MNARLARVKLNMSQGGLVEKSGVSRTTIYHIERGDIDNVKLGTLKKIAAALNSTVQELFLSEE